MKRPYNNNKTARLPGARITEKFKRDLKKWAGYVGVSQAQLLELSFYNYVTEPSNFVLCPKCSKPNVPKDFITLSGILKNTCQQCGHEYSIEMEKI